MINLILNKIINIDIHKLDLLAITILLSSTLKFEFRDGKDYSSLYLYLRPSNSDLL